MDSKLQELTEKIYSEGVERGKQQAAEIVAKAETEAHSIVEKAKSDAEAIMADARKRATELDQNTRSELKLFTQQAVNGLKTDITNLITSKITENAVKGATSDAAFMQGIIRMIAEKWVKDGVQEMQWWCLCRSKETRLARRSLFTHETALPSQLLD